MIDWFTIVIPIPHKPVNGGCVIASDEHGELDFKSDRKLSFRSSHENNVMIRSSGSISIDGWYSELWIDGNLTKWLQGHNYCGTDDGPAIVADFLRHAVDQIPIEWHPRFYTLSASGPYMGLPIWERQVREGNFICKRLDITYSYQMENNKEVSEYIEFLAETTRTKFTRAVAHGDSTVYWNKKSTHWSMKAYNKHRESTKAKGKTHKLPEEWPLEVREAMHQIIEPYLRWELVLRSRTLKDIAVNGGYADAYWNAVFCAVPGYNGEQSPAGLFDKYMEKIQVADMTEYQIDTAIEKLTHPAYGTFAAWQSGVNVQRNLKRATYFRHRKEILGAMGVDIALNPHAVKRHQGARVRVFRMIRQDDQQLAEKVSKVLKYAA